MYGKRTSLILKEGYLKIIRHSINYLNNNRRWNETKISSVNITTGLVE